jgi:hypothetical protein
MKTKSYERVWVWETSKPGKETEFRRREKGEHTLQSRTTRHRPILFVALRLISKAGQ